MISEKYSTNILFSGSVYILEIYLLLLVIYIL